MKTIYFCHHQQSSSDERINDLEMAGYHVLAFETGGDLMRAIAQDYPDLVLLDVLLEGKNGFEVAAGMDLHEQRNFPVALFAGIYARPVFREFAQSIGVTDFIEGDLSRSELLARVHLLTRDLVERDGEPPRSNVA